MTLLEIPYTPHPGQQPFHNSKARNRVWIGGRQGGKTKAGSQEAFKLSIQTGENSVGFIVAPTYWHVGKCWREFRQIIWGVWLEHCRNHNVPFSTNLPNALIKQINKVEHFIILQPNRYVWFKSADNPDSLRSERIDWSWLDECAMIKEEGYDAIEPALMGRNIFTSTPKGHNWVFQLWAYGQDPHERDYESWQYPTSINPYYPKDKIVKARAKLPDLVFRQEYLGEFIEDIGAVFRNVRSHIKTVALVPQAGHRYVVGADLAKHEDFTVLGALDTSSGELHGYDRFNQLDWVFQRKRIMAFCKHYNNARLLIDSTGVGDPVYDELRREAVHVDGYKFTNASKADLIENLSLMLDNNRISYPDIPELINELRLFGYEQGRTGLIHYHAPEGYHDDIVIALALAAWQLKKSKKPVGVFF